MGHQNQLPPSESYEACMGCGACAAACPQNAIIMQPDSEGFPAPVIQPDTCNDCGLCRRVCPVNPGNIATRSTGTESNKPEPLAVYAAWHLDEHIRWNSSSGGIFTALAEYILANHGVVAGAAFDENLVVRHVLIESSEEFVCLRGSKYVQSQIEPALYTRIRELLKKDKLVLFSGTPCQVAGLRSFLRCAYDNLFCCDIICHGVPSPLLLSRYIESKSTKSNQIVNVEFRDKTIGWRTFGVRRYYKNGSNKFLKMSDDPYMAAFLSNNALRSACYACHFKSAETFSDLTIADFWGVARKYPEYDDGKGTSLIFVNNHKGKNWLEACGSHLFLGRADIETAIRGNPMRIRSCLRPAQRGTFYIDLQKCSFSGVLRKYKIQPRSWYRRLLSDVKWGFIARTKRIIKTVRSAKRSDL